MWKNSFYGQKKTNLKQGLHRSPTPTGHGLHENERIFCFAIIHKKDVPMGWGRKTPLSLRKNKIIKSVVFWGFLSFVFFVLFLFFVVVLLIFLSGKFDFVLNKNIFFYLI